MGLLSNISKTRVWVLQSWQDGIAQGVMLLLLIVPIIGCFTVSTASTGFIPWFIEVGVIYQNHALNTNQHLQSHVLGHQGYRQGWECSNGMNRHDRTHHGY